MAGMIKFVRDCKRGGGRGVAMIVKGVEEEALRCYHVLPDGSFQYNEHNCKERLALKATW